MKDERTKYQSGLVTYPNGDKGILVAGGKTKVTTTEFLNLQTLTWSPKASLPFDISWGSTVEFGQSFAIIGGVSDTRGYELNTILYYDPESDSWRVLDKTLKKPRQQFSAFWVSDEFAKCNE